MSENLSPNLKPEKPKKGYYRLPAGLLALSLFDLVASYSPKTDVTPISKKPESQANQSENNDLETERILQEVEKKMRNSPNNDKEILREAFSLIKKGQVTVSFIGKITNYGVEIGISEGGRPFVRLELSNNNPNYQKIYSALMEIVDKIFQINAEYFFKLDGSCVNPYGFNVKIEDVGGMSTGDIERLLQEEEYVLFVVNGDGTIYQTIWFLIPKSCTQAPEIGDGNREWWL